MHSSLSPADVGDLPPELTGGLTFHLPMELVALGDGGASEGVRSTRIAEGLAEAFAAGMIDPPLYRWAVQRYQTLAGMLLAGDEAERRQAFAQVAPLGDGLAGAAFHGLIRLGYGAWQRNLLEVARGLAYLRVRRQVLSEHASSADRRQRHVHAADPSDIPDAHFREGATVFDLLNIAAGTGLTWNPLSPAATPRALALRCAELVLRNPSSFVAVHSMTGLHALCEVHQLVVHRPPAADTFDAEFGSWVASFGLAAQACGIVVESDPPETMHTYDNSYGEVNSVDSLVKASLASAETHDVKLAVALRRLVHFGLLSDAEATTVGIARLSSGQLDR